MSESVALSVVRVGPVEVIKLYVRIRIAVAATILMISVAGKNQTKCMF